MKKEALKRIFEFLEEKEEHNAPFLWKLINNLPLTEEDLNVKGDLDLSWSIISSLPEGLKVMGNLLLFGSAITSLPEGLEVGGDLDLSETNITLLPKGLQVGGKLNISGTQITSLPEGLEVGENLYIRYTELEQYSFNELRDMIKPGVIKGQIIV